MNFQLESFWIPVIKTLAGNIEPMELKFSVEPDSREKLRGLKVGYLVFENCKVEKTNEQTDALVKAATAQVMARYQNPDNIEKDAIIDGMRSLFRDLGIDPKKERPAGEALIVRVVKGKGIYRINTPVDINNAISMMSAYPCSVYDLEKIGGRAVFLVGKEGQNYPGLGGREVKAQNRLLVRDEASIFGGPGADSDRTAVNLETKKILMLIYCPKNSEQAFLEKVMDKAKAMMSICGAKPAGSGVYEIA